MPSFKDTNGREWSVRLDGPTIRDVRKSCDVDLADNGQFHERLAQDICLLVDVLWEVCKRHAPDGYTDRQFGEAINGDILERASAALLEAALDFFPPKKRSLVSALVSKNREVMEEAERLVMSKLADAETITQVREAMERELTAGLQRALADATGRTSVTSTPASSESAPTD